VSQWVVSRILHEQLLYPYHVQRVQGLSPADYPVRRHFCKWFLLDCGSYIRCTSTLQPAG
jgi:hypothetical protein